MEKYFINDEEVTREDFDKRLEEEVDNYTEEVYDGIIDEVYGDINICGINYSASIALYRVDPIAYRCGLSDEKSHQLEEAGYNLERYGRFEVNGEVFEIIEEEEEEAEA